MNILTEINYLLKEHDISESKLSVCFEKTSFAYKSYKFHTSSNLTGHKFDSYFYDYRRGVLPFFECIKQLETIKKQLTEYVLVIVEDAESAEIGMILLKNII